MSKMIAFASALALIAMATPAAHAGGFYSSPSNFFVNTGKMKIDQKGGKCSGYCPGDTTMNAGINNGNMYRGGSPSDTFINTGKLSVKQKGDSCKGYCPGETTLNAGVNNGNSYGNFRGGVGHW